jgi:putative flippase GtrA
MKRFEFRRCMLRLSELRFARFLLSGATNTLVTYAIYVCLLMMFSYQASYAISYVVGILFSFVMNSLFVFKSHQGIRSILYFPLVYVVQYLGGVANFMGVG